jgi:DNA-3-methyladenine glycosylase I
MSPTQFRVGGMRVRHDRDIPRCEPQLAVTCLPNPSTYFMTMPWPIVAPTGWGVVAIASPSMERRCQWAENLPAPYQRYHDEEWGVPSHDERHLFEMLVLEGAQAGLSWLTILNKRDHYRKVFEGFDPRRVARFGPRRIQRLLEDPGIVRNRAKVEATVVNARKTLEATEEFGSLDAYLWGFVGDRPIRNSWRSLSEIPPETPESRAMSKDLKRRGFNFVGPTICYAFMQAVGMVNDHVVRCFRYRQV